MSRRPRILQLSGADYTVKNQLLPLIDRCRQFADVEIACAAGPDSERLARQGYRFHAIPFSRSESPLDHLRALAATVRLLRRERYDLLHTHTPIAAAIARVAAAIARVPLVVNTAHGFYFHEHMPAWKYRVHLFAEWFLGRLTDFSFFQSREDLQSALAHGICRRETGLWISNGIDLARFDPDRPGLPEAAAAIRDSLQIPREAVLVTMVGRLVREKGYYELLEAFRRSARARPDLHLMIIGPEQDGDRDGVLAAIRAAQSDAVTGSRLRYAGYQTDLPAYLKASDLFVLPSHREGMPRTIIEAMAMGLPVIATEIRGCREEVVPEETGLLVPPRQAGPLAQAIARLASDGPLRRRMGDRAREAARAQYDERQVLERQAEVLQRLLAR